MPSDSAATSTRPIATGWTRWSMRSPATRGTPPGMLLDRRSIHERAGYRQRLVGHEGQQGPPQPIGLAPAVRRGSPSGQGRRPSGPTDGRARRSCADGGHRTATADWPRRRSAVDLGHDVVDVGRWTAAGSSIGPPPLARRMAEQLLCPPPLPLGPVPALRRRPAPAGDAAPRAGGDPQAARAGMASRSTRLFGVTWLRAIQPRTAALKPTTSPTCSPVQASPKPTSMATPDWTTASVRTGSSRSIVWLQRAAAVRRLMRRVAAAGCRGAGR